jgi:hypothetical protein
VLIESSGEGRDARRARRVHTSLAATARRVASAPRNRRRGSDRFTRANRVPDKRQLTTGAKS